MELQGGSQDKNMGGCSQPHTSTTVPLHHAVAESRRVVAWVLDKVDGNERASRKMGIERRKTRIGAENSGDGTSGVWDPLDMCHAHGAVYAVVKINQ